MTTQLSQSYLRKTILRLEAERIEAMIKKDVASLSKLLADELSYIHSGGRRDSKQSLIEFIGSSTSNYLAVDYDQTEVIECGTAAVLVRGVARLHLGSRIGQSEEIYSVFFTDVWGLRNAEWQMIAWNATRVPD